MSKKIILADKHLDEKKVEEEEAEEEAEEEEYDRSFVPVIFCALRPIVRTMQYYSLSAD